MPDAAKNNQDKRRQLLLTKVLFAASLIIFAYFAFKYWQTKHEEDQSKHEKVSEDIFDLQDGYEGQEENISQMTVGELKDRGSTFVYHTIIRHQVEIEELTNQIKSLQLELTKYRAKEKFNRIVIAYVDLREKIFKNKDFTKGLDSFELLTNDDEYLSGRVLELKTLLSDLPSQEFLSQEFRDLIPEILASKINDNESFFDKIKRGFSRLIIIRRIDGKNPAEIDSVVLRMENMLKDEDYQGVIENILTLPEDKQEVANKFMGHLNCLSQVKKIDQEILSHLKNIS